MGYHCGALAAWYCTGREALRGPGKHGLVAHKSRHTMAIAATSTETTAVSSPSTSPAPPALVCLPVVPRVYAPVGRTPIACTL